MKRSMRKFLAALLCMSLMMCMMLPAFAANSANIGFSLTLDKTQVTSSTSAQTVIMTIKMSQSANLVDMEYDIVCPDGFSITEPTTPGGTGMPSWNAGTRHMSWMNGTDVNTDTLGTAVITIPANVAAGTYTIRVNNIRLSESSGADYWETGASASVSLTVTEAAAADGYTAGISAGTASVNVGDTVYFGIDVLYTGTDSIAKFAAGKVVLNFDSTHLTFAESASTLNNAEVNVSGNTLTLVDHGEDQSFANGVYRLAFAAIKDGATSVTMTSAAFTDKVGAETSDLKPATLASTSAAIVIQKQRFQIDLPAGDMFKDDNLAIYGEDYILEIADDGKYYTYESITVTMNGSPVRLIDNGDGTYTIENVTGPIAVTATRTPKSYDVTVTGDTVQTDGAKATYKTDYHFTLPADEPAGIAPGYTYTLTSVTIDGKAYSGYTVQGKTYTIAGNDIIGNIAIAITKTDLDANQFTVSVTGTGAGHISGSYPAIVNKGASHTMMLAPQAGYNYTVTATMNGNPVTPTKDGNNYTVANITGNVVFTISAAVDTSGVSVSQYVPLDGSIMWLVKNAITVDSGKVPTYNGNPMFYSQKYNAYCYLVIVSGDTFAAETAKAQIGIASGTATNVDYGMDINKTGVVDVSDAQLVYNMYNAMYSDFTTSVTMEKFLRADTNNQVGINVADAAAIVAAIMPAT